MTINKTDPAHTQITFGCMSVNCPECGSTTHFPCFTKDGKLRETPHLRRIAAKLRQSEHIIDGYVDREALRKAS